MVPSKSDAPDANVMGGSSRCAGLGRRPTDDHADLVAVHLGFESQTEVPWVS